MQSETAPSRRRKYARRTEEERIHDLEDRVQALRSRLEQKEKKREIPPVIKEIPRLQKKLKKFAGLALASGRNDIANSVLAFVAGLDRIYRSDLDPEPKRAPRADPDDPLSGA